MKQLLLDLQNGEVCIEDVPLPVLKNGVIVETAYSLISAGTEGALLSLAGKSLLGKARERPDLANKVIAKMKTDGVLSGYQQAMSRLAKPEPLGYSCAGVVTQTNVSDFSIGDRVACAGAGYANHAEMNYIPKNLCVRVPDAVSLRDASFTTVGAIAMQGVRNARIQVGEATVVIGLGLIGLLTVQILKAAGCRVLAIDVDQKKIALATDLGADVATNYDNITGKMESFSSFGADAVIITAATKSNGPVELAGDLVRQQGRVVAVGMVGMELPREKYYDKEAEFVVSRSYGPGRYDRQYEEKGIDYPIAVRWTERRNMESFLGLLAEGKVSLDRLITHEFSGDDAVAAYDLIEKRKEPFIGVVLRYDGESERKSASIVHIAQGTGKKAPAEGVVRLGCIGAGIQALSALFPQFSKLPVHLTGLATATGLSGTSVAKKYGFEYCTTDYHEILKDEKTDAVIISTRNDLHAQMAIEAMRAGKRVFVEKPLATTMEDLERVVSVWKECGGQLQVGFNRRYSPLTRQLTDFFKERSSPMVIHYRVNAGPIPPDLWVNDAEQGGGMLISECCHFIDYILCLTGARPVEVYAKSVLPGGSGSGSEATSGSINRFSNLQIVISLDDGSIGTVTYTTLGDKAYSKEQIEVFCDGSVGVLTDFRELRLVKDGKEKKTKRWLSQDKGFFEELEGFVRGDTSDFYAAVDSTLVTFMAWESVEKGVSIPVEMKEPGMTAIERD